MHLAAERRLSDQRVIQTRHWFRMISAIVIGGGLGGLSAAIGLALNGHQVTLLEAQPEFSEVSRTGADRPSATSC